MLQAKIVELLSRSSSWKQERRIRRQRVRQMVDEAPAERGVELADAEREQRVAKFALRVAQGGSQADLDKIIAEDWGFEEQLILGDQLHEVAAEDDLEAAEGRAGEAGLARGDVERLDEHRGEHRDLVNDEDICGAQRLDVPRVVVVGGRRRATRRRRRRGGRNTDGGVERAAADVNASNAGGGAEGDLEAERRDEVRVQRAEEHRLAAAGLAADEEIAALCGEVHHALLLLVEVVEGEGAGLGRALELVAVALGSLREGVVEKSLRSFHEFFIRDLVDDRGRIFK